MEIDNKGNIFAATQNGYIYRSNDNGDSWTKVLNSNYGSINKILIFDNNKIFIATWNAGILMSSDDGTNWTLSGLEQKTILTLSKDSNGAIYAGLNDYGLYVSNDTGKTWNKVILSQYGLNVSCILIKNDTIIAGTNGNYLYKKAKSDSIGTQIFADHSFESTSLLYQAKDKSLLTYVSTIKWTGNFGVTIGGLYKSTDNGNSWNEINFFSNKYVQYIIEDSTGEMYFATDGHSGGVYTGKINGFDFIPRDSFLLSLQISSLALATGNTIFSGTYGKGIFKSTDKGISWNSSNHGLVNTQITGLVVNSKNDVFASINGEGVFHSSNNGKDWDTVNNGLIHNYVTGLFIKDDILFAGLANDGIYRSTNNGESWDSVNTGIIIGYGLSNRYINSFASDSRGYIFAGSNQGLYMSTDNGDNWSLINPNYIFSVGTNDTIIFVCASDTKSIATYKQISLDSGWIKINNGLVMGVSGSEINTFKSNKSGAIFASATGGTLSGFGIFRSYNNGDKWNRITNGLSNSTGYTDVYTIKIRENNDIYVGRYPGIYKSMNSGDLWFPFSDGLDTVTVKIIETDKNGIMYAGTDADGIYVNDDINDIKELLIDNNKSILNITPNPVNENYTVSFSLNEPETISLKIFNILGTAITVPVNLEEYQMGTFKINMNAYDL